MMALRVLNQARRCGSLTPSSMDRSPAHNNQCTHTHTIMNTGPVRCGLCIYMCSVHLHVNVHFTKTLYHFRYNTLTCTYCAPVDSAPKITTCILLCGFTNISFPCWHYTRCFLHLVQVTMLKTCPPIGESHCSLIPRPIPGMRLTLKNKRFELASFSGPSH